MNHFEEFKKILEGKVNGVEIKLDTELKSLGIDSLDLVEIIMEAEEKYGIEFDNEELSEFVTVEDVVKAIDKRTK